MYNFPKSLCCNYIQSERVQQAYDFTSKNEDSIQHSCFCNYTGGSSKNIISKGALRRKYRILFEQIWRIYIY